MLLQDKKSLPTTVTDEFFTTANVTPAMLVAEFDVVPSKMVPLPLTFNPEKVT